MIALLLPFLVVLVSAIVIAVVAWKRRRSHSNLLKQAQDFYDTMPDNVESLEEARLRRLLGLSLTRSRRRRN